MHEALLFSFCYGCLGVDKLNRSNVKGFQNKGSRRQTRPSFKASVFEFDMPERGKGLLAKPQRLCSQRRPSSTPFILDGSMSLKRLWSYLFRSAWSPSEGHNPPRGSLRKFASQRGSARVLESGSARLRGVLRGFLRAFLVVTLCLLRALLPWRTVGDIPRLNTKIAQQNQLVTRNAMHMQLFTVCAN